MKNKNGFFLLGAGCLLYAAGAFSETENISLPAFTEKGRMTFEEAVSARRSVRSFRSDPLDIRETGQLLRAAQGITDARRGLRAAPSAGATYPLEIYLVSGTGVYHYSPSENMLRPVKKGDLRPALARAALGQRFVSEAPVSIVIAAVYRRTAQRYGEERGRRYVYMEVGHAAQNIHLQAAAMGLGSVPVGAFRDHQVKKLLALPEDHEPLYIIPVGHPASG